MNTGLNMMLFYAEVLGTMGDVGNLQAGLLTTASSSQGAGNLLFCSVLRVYSRQLGQTITPISHQDREEEGAKLRLAPLLLSLQEVSTEAPGQGKGQPQWTGSRCQGASLFMWQWGYACVWEPEDRRTAVGPSGGRAWWCVSAPLQPDSLEHVAVELLLPVAQELPDHLATQALALQQEVGHSHRCVGHEAALDEVLDALLGLPGRTRDRLSQAPSPAPAFAPLPLCSTLSCPTLSPKNGGTGTAWALHPGWPSREQVLAWPPLGQHTLATREPSLTLLSTCLKTLLIRLPWFPHYPLGLARSLHVPLKSWTV